MKKPLTKLQSMVMLQLTSENFDNVVSEACSNLSNQIRSSACTFRPRSRTETPVENRPLRCSYCCHVVPLLLH